MGSNQFFYSLDNYYGGRLSVLSKLPGVMHACNLKSFREWYWDQTKLRNVFCLPILALVLQLINV